MPSRCLSPPPAAYGLPPHPSHLLLPSPSFFSSSLSLYGSSIALACSGSTSSSSVFHLCSVSGDWCAGVNPACRIIVHPWIFSAARLIGFFRPLITHPASFPIPSDPSRPSSFLLFPFPLSTVHLWPGFLSIWHLLTEYRPFIYCRLFF